MTAQRGFAPIIIILIILLAGTSIFVAANTFLKTSPKPALNLPENTPLPTSKPTTTPLATSGPATTQSKTSQGSTGLTSDNVDVVAYPRSDNKAFYVDFKAFSFVNIASIYYNLNYDTDAGARGVETTFLPTADQIKTVGSTDSKLYIRRELLLGTCSKNVCVYDSNPKNFRLTVTTKNNSGDKSTQVKTLNF